MIEFKKPEIKNAEELYIKLTFEDLYTKFDNALKNDHTYLKITQAKTGGKTFRFMIIETGDSLNTDRCINVMCDNYETFKYFRTHNPFDNKLWGVLKLETSRKNFEIHGEANSMFIDELNKSYAIVEFQTKGEYEAQREVERLEEKLEHLEEKINDLTLKTEQLEKTKKNKFFI